MKKSALILALIVSVVISSCSVMKKNTTAKQDNSNLVGEWVLTYITGPRITFEGLYPETKPTIAFDLENNRISGNNSCNSYGGGLVLDKNKIKTDKVFSTMMACPGNGESTYMSTLGEIETFKVNGDSLSFYKGDIEMMRFVKK